MNHSIRTGIDPRSQASFSLANRLGRVAWAIGCMLFFRWTPRPCHAWRAFILRLFGAKLGQGCHIYPGVVIWAPWNLVVGDRAGIADGVECYNMATITVGADAVISQGAYLCTGTHDYLDPLFQLHALPIVIGAKAWICAQAFVGPGVTIGDGVVLGARSVACKDLPAWMVCAGQPATARKPRIMRDQHPEQES